MRVCLTNGNCQGLNTVSGAWCLDGTSSLGTLGRQYLGYVGALAPGCLHPKCLDVPPGPSRLTAYE